MGRLKAMLFAAMALATTAPLGSLDHAYAQASPLVARNPPGKPRSESELEARERALSAPAKADTLTPQLSKAAEAQHASQAKADRIRRFEANAEALLSKRRLSPAKHARALAVVLEAMRAREEAAALILAGATARDLIARAEAGDEALKALLIKAHPARVAHELILIMGEQVYTEYQRDRQAANEVAQ